MKKNDDQYFKWLKKNASSFIVNTRKTRNSNYFALHKSNCKYISQTDKYIKGAYTERDYIKIGSDNLNELKNWFEQNNSKFRGKFSACKTCNPDSKTVNFNPDFLYPETIENEKEVLFEGAKKEIIVNSYERNIKARQECLEHYGCSCSVCNFDFEKAYGIIGKNFIHVHHLKEISEIGNSYVVDPIIDLRPVCPNCHAMLHQRKKPCYTIEELIRIIKINSRQQTVLQ